jgi:hypothetical protein
LGEQQQCKELKKEEEKFGKQLDSNIGNEAKQWGKQEQKGTGPGLKIILIIFNIKIIILQIFYICFTQILKFIICTEY